MSEQGKSPQNNSFDLNQFLDLEDIPSKAPMAAGGLLAALGGFMAFVGFFLAWLGSSTGIKLATDYDNNFYCCVPLLGLVIILFGLVAAIAPFLRREIPLIKPITGGLLALLSVLLLCPIFMEAKYAKIGWWCAPVGAVLIVVGAVVALIVPSIMEQIKKT